MKTLLLFRNFGIWEILIIALIILLIFGGKKIPELMKGIGKGIKSLKRVFLMPTKTSTILKMNSGVNPRRKASPKSPRIKANNPRNKWPRCPFGTIWMLCAVAF